MNDISQERAAKRVERTQPEAHVFKVGQRVRLKSRFGAGVKAPEYYRVTATMPPVGGELQYRIRSDEERHDRVATQDNLERV